MSPEERQVFFKQRRQEHRAKRLSMLPPDVRERIEKMSLDERRAYFRELREKRRSMIRGLSPEDRERLQQMNPSERQEFFRAKRETLGA